MNRQDMNDDAERLMKLARVQAKIHGMRTVPVLFKPVLQPDGSMKLISADPNLPVIAGDVFIADVPVPDEFWPKRVTAIVRKVEDDAA